MSYREYETAQTVFSSMADLQRYLEKQKEDYQRGYNDYIAKHRASAYQRGREQAARDLEQMQRSNIWRHPYWL